MARMWRLCCVLAAAWTLAGASAASAEPVLVLGADGRARTVEDPFAGVREPAARAPETGVPPEPDGRTGEPAAAPRTLRATPKGPTVAKELDRLLAAGLITQADRDARRASYIEVRKAARAATGWRRTELAGALAAVEGIAARGQLTPSRLPLLWLTLERNRRWWATGPLPAAGRRVTFAGSELLWQYLPGQGLHMHPLANFGRLNGLWQGGKRYDARLAQLLDELLPLASERAGGLAWEYTFAWANGLPPWASGMAQATAVQALGRAAIRLGRGEPVLAVARRALPLFGTPAPEGVLVPGQAGGSHYLLYSFDPDLRVLNGFLQALIGLHHFATTTGDATALALFSAGDQAAQLETPTYDTGAWSLYSRGRLAEESDLGYHKLLRDFLVNLCRRTAAPAYCGAGAHFTAYLKQPPRLGLRTRGAKPRKVARVRVAVDKVSDVRVVVRSPAGTVVLDRLLARAGRGEHLLRWRAGRRRGTYSVEATAADLAGNRAAIGGAFAVS